MSNNFLPLPRPQYSRDGLTQWVLPRKDFPLDSNCNDTWHSWYFPHIRWRAREEKAQEEEHWGSIQGLTLTQKIQLLENCPETTVLFDWGHFEGKKKSTQETGEWRHFFQFSLPLLPQISLFHDHIILRHLGPSIEHWQWPIPPLTVHSSSQLVSKREIPSYSEWEKLFARLQSEFSSTNLRKVVLARKKILSFSAPLNHQALWNKLQSFQDSTYRIMIRPQENSCFYSLTPERLFKREGNQCYVDAIAGSCKNLTLGKPIKDTESQALLSSEKNRYEHEIVVNGIVQKMKDLYHDFYQEQMRVISLHYVQHLKTPLLFTLKNDTSLSALHTALYPTAALGGWPKEKALQFLKDHKIFDRGLYGAPIGRWTAQNQEYVVAIRSALAVEKELHVFAGAGIVPQSQVASEWQEMEDKMGYFL